MVELVVPDRKVKGYGWKPSLPDPREPIANVGGIKVLGEVDPRAELAAWVEDQGQLGSCTANATATCFRYDAALDGKDPGQLARLWIYYFERKLEGTLGQGDTGAMGHDAFRVARTGIPPETAWPYEIGTFDEKPPAEAVKDEKYYVLKRPYASVPQSQSAIKAVVSNKQTVALGFVVYESFESSEVAKTGIVPMPGPDEEQVGGHEVLLCGYLKSEPHYALVMNSWGSKKTDGAEWGIDGSGFFLMPWAYILDNQLTSDLRTITRAL